MPRREGRPTRDREASPKASNPGLAHSESRFDLSVVTPTLSLDADPRDALEPRRRARVLGPYARRGPHSRAVTVASRDVR